MLLIKNQTHNFPHAVSDTNIHPLPEHYILVPVS